MLEYIYFIVQKINCDNISVLQIFLFRSNRLFSSDQNNQKPCLSCKNIIANKSSNIRRNKQNRLMLVSTCFVCGKKKIKFH